MVEGRGVFTVGPVHVYEAPTDMDADRCFTP